MTSPVTKRLHISGLTPSITATDLSQRLSKFGTVKALDGFGLLDGVGLPRKFGYVTIETTEAGLKKCLNVLSGSTYKGAKLRIGEAKPDFQERLAKEREQASLEPPPQRLKRRRCDGVHASDFFVEESVSNVDEDRPEKMPVTRSEDNEAMEVVEVSMDGDPVERAESSESSESSKTSEPQETHDMDVQQEPVPVQAKQTTKLKDLFTPREEDAGFSLLEHLDLDLELDDEFIAHQMGFTQQRLSPPIAIPPIENTTPALPVPATAPFIPNPREPFFFPTTSSGSKTKDLFSIAQERGWNWRDPSVGFYRTQTDDEIRKRWEDGKVELTREWKKRWREAVKMRRRRGGMDAE